MKAPKKYKISKRHHCIMFPTDIGYEIWTYKLINIKTAPKSKNKSCISWYVLKTFKDDVLYLNIHSISRETIQCIKQFIANNY